MSLAVLSMGANLGDRQKSLGDALDALARLPGTSIKQVSSIYETDPVEVTSKQEDFLNQCVLLETSLSPHALLGACLGIEAGLGRVRREYHGARVLDLDLLLYENARCNSQELTIPHPRMFQRAFVLVPLTELFPDKTALGLDFSKDFEAINNQGIRLFQKNRKNFEKGVDNKD